VEGLVVSKPRAKVHPPEATKEAWELLDLRLPCPGQENRDDPQSVVDPILKGGSHFLVLPRSDALGTDENGTGAALIQCVLQALLPRIARDEIPYVKEWVDVD